MLLIALLLLLQTVSCMEYTYCNNNTRIIIIIMTCYCVYYCTTGLIVPDSAGSGPERKDQTVADKLQVLYSIILRVSGHLE